METMEMETRQRWQDWVNLFLGLWLFFTPFFGVGQMLGIAAYNGYVFGVIIVVLSGAALYRPQAWEEWINLAVGLWLIASPFVLVGYAMGSMLMWNSIIVGFLIGGDAFWAALTRPIEATHREHPHHA